MPTSQVDIVFRGVRDGLDPELVKKRLALAFKLEQAKIERIFKSRSATLKTSVDVAVADKYIKQLATIGIIATKRTAKSPKNHAAKPIYIPDHGIESPDADSMHQPIEFVYGDNIRRIPFVFTGNGFAYFKIWIVNILVCLFSAGLLYPWARVRSLRYIYQHTLLDGVEFFYAPKSQRYLILQLMLISCVLGLAYLLYKQLFLFSAIGAVALVSLMPLYWATLAKIQWQRSAYREIYFAYNFRLVDSYIYFLGWPLLAIFSAGLLAPLAAYKIQKYHVENKVFAGAPFLFTAKISQYLSLLPLLLCAEVAVGLIIYWRAFLPFWSITLLLIVIASIVLIRWRIGLVNRRWNFTELIYGYFRSSWAFKSYSALILKNIFFCCITLGLYWPWAKMQLANYAAQHVAFFANQGFEKWSRKQ